MAQSENTNFTDEQVLESETQQNEQNSNSDDNNIRDVKSDDKNQDKVDKAKKQNADSVKNTQSKSGSVKTAAALAAAQAECEKLKTELSEINDKFLRNAAEYENFRKRSIREKDSAFSGGICHAVEKMLPVIDTLTLAINAPTQDESYKKGVEMTLEQCKRAFEALGVKEVDALNTQFDPNLHAALASAPAPDGTESGTVLQVLQPGYMLADKVIRHAAVMVAD